jgi:hypothetical protein
MASGSATVIAAGSYYPLSESVTQTVALAFKAVFPDLYNLYQDAFKVGVWFADDPGPFLSHTIVYKLQGQLHKDCHDVGLQCHFLWGNTLGQK